MSYPVGDGPYRIALGDSNSDGKVDIATANSGSSDVSILLGEGNGKFRQAVNYAVFSSPSSLAVGDFNGDGNLDIVTSDYGEPEGISVLLGIGRAGSLWG